MIPARHVSGRSVGVLGLGRSGLGAMRAIHAGGGTPIGWDDAAEVRERALRDGWSVADLTASEVMSELATLVVSPGIAHLYPAPHPVISAALAAGIPLDNDVGVLFRSLPSDIQTVAVTGSNGKSTVCALIDHLLHSVGRGSCMAGNIGVGALDIDPPIAGTTLVLEISSYQAELASTLNPDIGVFLNLTPDHTDRHGGFGGYFAAKRQVFGGASLKMAVIGTSEIEGQFLACQLDRVSSDIEVIRLAGCPMSHGSWLACEGRQVTGIIGGQSVALSLAGCAELAGHHNALNAAAALAVCIRLGLSVDEVVAGCATFEGLAHRGRLVGTFGGIQCVNDSKATNAGSAAAALTTYRRIRWIVGGMGKEGGITELETCLGNVRKAYLIGESAAQFAAQLGSIPKVRCGDMATAVRVAASECEPGDTLLLAPAAASFDQFADFEARGRCFEQEVRKCLG